MTDASLHAAITRRRTLWESYLGASAGARADATFAERQALNAVIVAELRRRDRPFDHAGRRWGLTHDRLNYCELKPGTTETVNSGKERGRKIAFDYAR